MSDSEIKHIMEGTNKVKKKSHTQAQKEEAAAKLAERECGAKVNGHVPSDFAGGVNT